jgi:hypothetical protein
MQLGETDVLSEDRPLVVWVELSSLLKGFQRFIKFVGAE